MLSAQELNSIPPLELFAYSTVLCNIGSLSKPRTTVVGYINGKSVLVHSH